MASDVSLRAAAQSSLNGAWMNASNTALMSSPSSEVTTWPGPVRYSSGRSAYACCSRSVS